MIITFTKDYSQALEAAVRLKCPMIRVEKQRMLLQISINELLAFNIKPVEFDFHSQIRDLELIWSGEFSLEPNDVSEIRDVLEGRRFLFWSVLNFKQKISKLGSMEIANGHYLRELDFFIRFLKTI